MDCVTLDGVSKLFGPVRAVVSVSAVIRSEEIVVVRGANGSGKSTLLALLAGLARPSSGRVGYPGLGGDVMTARSRLGWVGHESLCYSELSGRENVELAARLYGVRAPKEAYDRTAKRFGLGSFADRPFRTYSRGQRQRTALARALVHEPAWVLFDEPTTGLDASGVEELVTAIREEKARGAAVVVVTHDEPFERAVADRTLIMERGRMKSS